MKGVTTLRASWLIPFTLILLSLIPVTAGAVRLAMRFTVLVGGAEITAEDARFFTMPLPVALHFLSGSLFTVVGAFQFSVRLRWTQWHRLAGRFLVLLGFAAALTGLWLTQFYPPNENDGALLYWFRLVFGAAMVISIAFGLAAIRRRDINRHRAWMIRGYAIGLGPGTQSLVGLLWLLAFGEPGELMGDLLLGACWAANLAVAEIVIRRQLGARIPRPAAT